MDETELLVRLLCAAALAFLTAMPAFAGSATTINVGLVVTGDFASALAGTWQSRTAARGSIYHFVVSGGSGTFYQLVSVPRRGGKGSCDLRVGGSIFSLEPAAGRYSYEMQYSVQSADVVGSVGTTGACRDLAAAYLSGVPAAESLILSRTDDGRLVDRATGAEYVRAR